MQGTIADQVTDIGNHPFRTGLDKLVVIILFQVFFQYRNLFCDHRQQGL
ncbi:MAG: hypothetical protein GQ542_02170 [Desulforhopalus sp.]|nr:hypothetical protein [Desulforhopalus sp.]